MCVCVCVAQLSALSQQPSSVEKKGKSGKGVEVAVRKRNEVMQHFSLIYFDGIFEEEPIKLSRRCSTLTLPRCAN